MNVTNKKEFEKLFIKEMTKRKLESEKNYKKRGVKK